MKYSKTFTNSNSQTVSIPVDYKLTDNVKKVQPSYENLMKVVNNFSDDFMDERI